MALAFRRLFRGIRTARASGSECPPARYNHRDCPEHDLDVICGAQGSNILQIVIELSLHILDVVGVSNVDLSQARETGLDPQSVRELRDFLVHLCVEIVALGPRPNNAHISTQNVEKLWGLVDSCLSYNAADCGDAGIVPGRPLGDAVLRPNRHAAELIHLKRLAVFFVAPAIARPPVETLAAVRGTAAMIDPAVESDAFLRE